MRSPMDTTGHSVPCGFTRGAVRLSRSGASFAPRASKSQAHAGNPGHKRTHAAQRSYGQRYVSPSSGPWVQKHLLLFSAPLHVWRGVAEGIPPGRGAGMRPALGQRRPPTATHVFRFVICNLTFALRSPSYPRMLCGLQMSATPVGGNRPLTDRSGHGHSQERTDEENGTVLTNKGRKAGRIRSGDPA